MTTKRIFQRLTYYPIKGLINLIEPINSNLYMKGMTSLLRTYGVTINGNLLYVHKSVRFDDFNKITLGDNVVISFGVYFLTHDYSRLVAYNFINNRSGDLNNLGNIDNPLIDEIKIGDNTFLGCRALLLPRTSIGKNCIIGSGCVIKGNIPDNSVVIGNPAKIIGKTEDFGEKWLKQHQIEVKNGYKITSN